jgi:hypothetical protein
MRKNIPRFSQVLASLLRPTIKEYDSKLPTIAKRMLGHVILLSCVGVGIAIMSLEPLSVLVCRRVETKQVDCRIQKRIAWVIPVREKSISHLQRAYVNPELVTGTDDDGDEYSYYVYEVVLVGASGELGLKGSDGPGSSSTRTAQRINAYLNTPAAESLTIGNYGLFDHTLLTLAGGFFVVLFGFLFVTTLLNSILLFGAWGTEFVLFVAGWIADRAGLDKERLARLRRAVRGVATSPDE